METSRRALLGGMAIAPVAAAIPVAFAAPSPLLAAVAASKAADARFGMLPGDLEDTDPALHLAEEERMLAAHRHACKQAPATWAEFVVLLDHMTAGGAFGLDDDKAEALLMHARRLAGETARG